METLSIENISEKLKVLLKEQIDYDFEKPVELDTSLVDDLNIDSLDAVNLLLSLEEEFDIDISDEDASKIITFKDAVEYIYSALNNKNNDPEQKQE